MAHTATSTVGKDADSAPSKNIFLFGQHTQSRTLGGRHAHELHQCKEREHSYRVHVTCSFTKLINDVATRLSCQNAYRNFRSRESPLLAANWIVHAPSKSTRSCSAHAAARATGTFTRKCA